MSIVAGSASHLFEALKNRIVSYGNPVGEEIDFGGSVGAITVYPVAQGPAENVTLTVRISGVGGTYEHSYGSAGRNSIYEQKTIPQLPKGKYVVEVRSTSQNEWTLLKVGFRYMNGTTYTAAGEASPQAPCTCAILLLITTAIMGLLTWVF